jgi:hypothetical protein
VESSEGEWELSEPILHQQLVANSQSLGLTPLAPEPEESETEAVRRVVERAITGNLSGDIALLPLGAAIGPIRATRNIRVYPENFAAVLSRVAEIRAEPGFAPFRREPVATAPAPDSAPLAGEPSASAAP